MIWNFVFFYFGYVIVTMAFYSFKHIGKAIKFVFIMRETYFYYLNKINGIEKFN